MYFRGNPLYQATKRHLTVKRRTMRCRTKTLIWLGWAKLFSCRVLGRQCFCNEPKSSTVPARLRVRKREMTKVFFSPGMASHNFPARSLYSRTAWFRNSLQIVMLQNVSYIRFFCSASMFTVWLNKCFALTQPCWLIGRKEPSYLLACLCVMY